MSALKPMTARSNALEVGKLDGQQCHVPHCERRDLVVGDAPTLAEMESPGRVVLDLEISVAEPRLADLLAFLRRAVPFYEQPGGIRVTLLRDDQRPGRYIERVEYVDEAAFAFDQRRIAEVEQMKALLAEWRGLLQEPPVVRVYRTIGIA